MPTRVQFVASLAAATVRPAPARAPQFDFRSNPLLNLHHRLYKTAHAAQTRIEGEPLASEARSLLAADSKFDSRDAIGWRDAVETYRRAFVVTDRDLLFDRGLESINTSLSDARAGAISREIPAEIARALATTYGPYHRVFWPQDDVENRAWIQALRRLLIAYAGPFPARLATVYHIEWPPMPFRIDVVRYGYRFGAYTATETDFVHTVMESADPRLAGLAAFEMLYHEASHAVVFEDAGTVGSAIAAAAASLHRPEPAQFWHATIFYTAGILARDIFAAHDVAYEPYADRNGLFSARVWPDYRAPLEAHWYPYMREAADAPAMRIALATCVRDIASDAGPRHRASG